MSHPHANQRPRAADVRLKVFIVRFKRILGRVGTSGGGNLQSALVFKAALRAKVKKRFLRQSGPLVLQVSTLTHKEGPLRQI